MKYLKIMGLCLVAVLALSAVTVASASAQEMELVNKEGKALVKNKFKGESGKGTLEATNGSKITCTKTKFTGKTTNTKEGEAATTFTGCESKGFKCNTEGSGTGEIKTSLTLFIALSGGHWVFFLSILNQPDCAPLHGAAGTQSARRDCHTSYITGRRKTHKSYNHKRETDERQTGIHKIQD